MRALYKLAALAVAFSSVSPAMAGRMWLTNGDRLEGELVSLKDGKVEWQSKYFGLLKIDIKDVKGLGLSESHNVKMGDGGLVLLNDCTLAYAASKGQWLHCANGSTLVTSLRSIKAVSKDKLEAPKLAHKGHMDATYNSTKGNTDSVVIHLGADAEVRHDKMRHRGVVMYDREKLNGAISRDEENFKYSLDYFLSPIWFASANASYQSNPIVDLDSRTTFGLGVGHQFFDNEETALSGNLGVAFVQEDYIVAPDKDYTALRWSTDYRLKTGYFGAELVHKNEFLIPSNDLGEWLLQTDTGLRAPIWGGINGLVMFEFDYDNEPPIGKDKSDSKLSVGLNYSW